ncbi:MAG: LacI family DNA-binding transcriptional regulator [Actinomycetota bacterium]
MASHAGVSFKTVSRVINGEGGVSEEMARRVDEAVAALGYQLDHRARVLRSGEQRSSTIGFILVDVSNQFFGSLLRGIEGVASARQCLVFAASTDRSAVRERQLIEEFIRRRVDGLIIVYSGSDPMALRAEIERGTPTVFLDLEPEAVSADIVRSDHYGGARRVTEHLLSHGHRDIAFLGDDAKVYSATQRLAGYRDVMGAAAIAVPDTRIVTGSYDTDEWYARTYDLLCQSSLPTALFTAQNIVTLGAVRALHELELEHVVAQAGFDDVDLATAVRPPITVVTQDPLQLGREAAERLFARIDGDDSPPRQLIFETPLIVRGSGELPPSSTDAARNLGSAS